MTKKKSISPPWNATTRLVISLTIVAIAAVLVIRFRNIIAPLLMSFILAYLFHPVASFINRRTPLSWRMAVNLIYIILLIIVLSLVTLSGVSLVQQVQSLIDTVQSNIDALPGFIENLSTQVYHLGPFVIDLSVIDWNTIGQEVLSAVQPALGRLGSLVGALAGSAVSTLGWLAFIFIVSYFFLAESGGFRHRIIQVEIPGYADDVRLISIELRQIWNAFLRGQVVIFLATLLIYTFVFSILGVRYAIGLALIAGFANFLPYVGPAINWIVLGLITFFQTSNPLGLSPLLYTGIIIVIALVIDQIFNNLVAPRIMAETLKLHPASVLIAAIIAANLLGILGLLLAAPLLATLKLVGQYTLRKLLNQDPWPPRDEGSARKLTPSLRERLQTWWLNRRKKKNI